MSVLKRLNSVQIWLLLVCVSIILMVGVGGATRLTHSGLSMVDWKPITGHPAATEMRRLGRRSSRSISSTRNTKN